MMVSNRDSSSWNGSLSPKEFSVAASAFAKKWEKFNSLLPRWSWVSPKRPWIAAHEEDCDEGCHMSKEDPCCSIDNEPVDNATLEHPYLNRPWYTLHPCGTSEWMKLLYTDKAPMAKGGVPVEQYMVSWFSVVGQVVGLRLPLETLQGFRLDDWSLKKISS